MTDPVVQRDRFRLVGTVLDGRFRVDREVAEGGFGVVYYAIQVALERPVALKVLKTPTGMDAGTRIHFREKFAAEARTIARIRHPHIVDVHDFGISKLPSGEEAPWMALEWLEGKTLDEYLAARRGQGGQSPAHVLTLLRPVLRAFAYAHREGIAHRDIKPANIMVVSTESDPTTNQGTLLRVLDFGIAKLMDSDENAGTGQTRTAGMPAFSPPYAAPEQVAFGRTGPWTDVHALGLILTEMLVDAPPYREDNMQLFEEVMSPIRPTPNAKGRNVGPWEAVISKALALSPSERWKGAAELLEALEARVDAATKAAAKPAQSVAPPPYRLAKKHRPPSAVVSTDSTRPGFGSRWWILLATVVGIGLALAAVMRVYRHRSHEEQGRFIVQKPVETQPGTMQNANSGVNATTTVMAPQINAREPRPPVVVPVPRISFQTTGTAQDNPSIGNRIPSPSSNYGPAGQNRAATDPLTAQATEILEPQKARILPEHPPAAKRPETSHRRPPKIDIE